jgi:hypothetical protein
VSWYWWVLIWAFVLLLTGGVLAMFGLSLFRKARDLLRELEQASQRLGAVTEGLQELAERQKKDPAVFTSATQLRQEQILLNRRRGARTSPKPGQRV